jgi:hypothetical protein
MGSHNSVGRLCCYALFREHWHFDRSLFWLYLRNRGIDCYRIICNRKSSLQAFPRYMGLHNSAPRLDRYGLVFEDFDYWQSFIFYLKIRGMDHHRTRRNWKVSFYVI